MRPRASAHSSSGPNQMHRIDRIVRTNRGTDGIDRQLIRRPITIVAKLVTLRLLAEGRDITIGRADKYQSPDTIERVVDVARTLAHAAGVAVKRKLGGEGKVVEDAAAEAGDGLADGGIAKAADLAVIHNKGAVRGMEVRGQLLDLGGEGAYKALTHNPRRRRCLYFVYQNLLRDSRPRDLASHWARDGNRHS